MASWLHDLRTAIIAETRQRYELAWLLDDVKSDSRRLEDIGMSYMEIEAALRQDQRRRSPLRCAIAGIRPPTFARRQLHD